MPVARTQYFSNFRGLNERLVLNSSMAETTSLDNVIVQHGVIRGRKGINKWDDITTAETDTPIIQLAMFDRIATSANTLLRFTPLKVKVWNDAGGSWDDITGTALTGTATTRIQYATIKELDSFVFTNEGEDRPRIYTGSGNTATLGGTPPHAKALEYWQGFLALGNISAAGTTFLPINLVLSDAPNEIWETCSSADGTVVTFIIDETPGDILALKVLGEALMIYKTDGIVEMRLSGNLTRFSRYHLDFSMGILAPLSLQNIPQVGHIMLAQDRNLYLVRGRQVQPLPPNVQKSLREVMSIAKAPFVRSAIDLENEVYNLFYQRNGVDYMDGKLSYNWRTGEFYRSVYPVEFNSAVGYRNTQTTAWKVIASSATLTYELETGADDNGTAISRFYDFGDTTFGLPGDKWMTGAEFIFKKARDCRVRISVALDKSSKFVYSKTFTLQGSDPDETITKVDWQPPSPLFGTWFRVRVEMLHDAATNVCELQEFNPELIPVTQASETLTKSAQSLSS
jgi:hypothetical protein